MVRKKKFTMGKQKIEIKKLENEDARFVCFSKRKEGILSKATELATLCGAEIAILLESPKGSPYTFGSPGVNQVADRFLFGHQALSGLSVHEARRLSMVQQLNQQCMETSNLLEAAKKRRAELENRLNVLAQANQQVENAENMEKLNLPELLEMKTSLCELKERIEFKLYGQFSGGSTSNDVNLGMMVNPFITLNPLAAGVSEAGLTANPFTSTKLPEFGTNQPNPSHNRVNIGAGMNSTGQESNQPGPSGYNWFGQGFS